MIDAALGAADGGQRFCRLGYWRERYSFVPFGITTAAHVAVAKVAEGWM